MSVMLVKGASSTIRCRRRSSAAIEGGRGSERLADRSEPRRQSTRCQAKMGGERLDGAGHILGDGRGSGASRVSAVPGIVDEQPARLRIPVVRINSRIQPEHRIARAEQPQPVGAAGRRTKIRGLPAVRGGELKHPPALGGKFGRFARLVRSREINHAGLVKVQKH